MDTATFHHSNGHAWLWDLLFYVSIFESFFLHLFCSCNHLLLTLLLCSYEMLNKSTKKPFFLSDSAIVFLFLWLSCFSYFFSLLDVLIVLSKAIGCYKVSLECKDQMVKFYSQFGFNNPVDQNYMDLRWFDWISNISESLETKSVWMWDQTKTGLVDVWDSMRKGTLSQARSFAAVEWKIMAWDCTCL